MRLRDAQDVLTIDPNRVHEFVEHDRDFRCYVCRGRRRDRVHTDPRR